MGIVSRLVEEDSNSSTKPNDYIELTDDDLNDSPEQLDIKFADVKDKEDISKIENKLNKGHIVFIDISYIESNGLSIDVLYNQLGDIVDSIDGDIVHKKRNNTIIATPSNVNISRDKI